MRNYKQPMFQKPHYEFLARWFDDEFKTPDTLKYHAKSMARALKADNPNFNTDRFLEACGVDD